MIGEILVIAQAISFATMNVVDAHIVKKHVKHIYSFIAVSGLANVLISLPFLFFFWDNNLSGILFGVAAGIFFGLQAIIYYVVIEKEDASHMIGIIYMYPIFSLVIGSLVFGEHFSLLNYVGCAITLIGVFLTTQRTFAKWKILIPLTSIAFFVAAEEAFQNAASEHINFFFSSALQTSVMGLLLLSMLLFAKNRNYFTNELKNLKYAFLSEGLSLIAIFFLVSSFLYLPYIAVSFISVSQILFVVLIEKLWSIVNPNIMQDKQTMQKALALVLVAIGVILVMI